MKGICTVKHSLVRLGAIEIGSVRIGYNNRSSPRDLHIQMWISLLLIIPEKWFNNQNNLWSRLMKLCDVCMEISNQPYYHYWLYVTIIISTYDVCHLHRSHFNLHHLFYFKYSSSSAFYPQPFMREESESFTAYWAA